MTGTHRGTGTDSRWVARPLLAACVRLAVVLVPSASGADVGIVAGRALSGRLPTTAVLAIALAVSAIAAVAIERVVRRLLPLATLLTLSLAFPDGVPSRFRVARQAGSARVLRERVRLAHERGDADDPARAAEEILTLVAALSAHDRKTRGHSERVRAFTDVIAGELSMSDEDRDRLRWAALLHDIGKLMVPVSTLNKPGKPDEREWAQLKRHPLEGERIVAGLLPWLGSWSAVIAQHHERFDGGGYPRGMSGEAIHLGARIVSVSDSFEVMTAARSYKRPMTPTAARRELAACAGKQFDPLVVRALFAIPLRRLWWMVGPAAWVAQVPFMLGIGRAGSETVVAVRTAGELAIRGVTAVLAVTLSAVGVTGRGAVPRPAEFGSARLSASSALVADVRTHESLADDGNHIEGGGGHDGGHSGHGGAGSHGGGGSSGSDDGSGAGSGGGGADPAGGAADTVAGVVDSTVNAASGAVSDATDAVSGTVDTAVDQAGATADQTTDAVGDAVDGLGHAIGGLGGGR